MEFLLGIALGCANYWAEGKDCTADNGGCCGSEGLDVKCCLGVLVPLGPEYKFGITLAP